MAQIRLKGPKEKVAFIMDNIPETRYNYLHLLLSYWQLFDGIDIPDKVVQDIVEKGTAPESISRSRRRALEAAKQSKIAELRSLLQGEETEPEEVE